MPYVSRPSASQQAELVDPFVRAIREVFCKMIGVDPVAGRAHVNKSAAASHGICGIIEFHGQVVGSVTVRFSEGAAENLVQAFTGTPIPRSHPDFADAVGELANLIAGGAKRNLNRVASISTPTVTTNGYAATRAGEVPCLVIPCRCEHGVFAVEIALKLAARSAA